MNELFIYLLKAAAITGIFYSCYQLFLKKDTFFKANRHFLLAGLLSAVLLPFLVFTKVTYIERPLVEASNAVIPSTNLQIASVPIEVDPQIDWFVILTIVYLIGCLVILSRFFLQLLALRKLTKNKNAVKNGQFKVVTVDDEIAPFSFFNTIVYNPNLYSKEELDVIIEHEQVHCRQLHSLDMILSEVFLAFQWFNPLIWLYKRSIQQNLEFIADKEALESLNASKIYQQTLLKVSLGNYCTAVVNNFFNSLIKKRIIMINQQNSRKRNLFKMVFILPLLAIFLYSFNIKEETKFRTSANKESTISFISPIKKTDLQKISSGFGMHKSPFTKEKEFHKGIDLVAPRGTEVVATASGTIKLAKRDGNHGNRVIIEHENGYKSGYSHLQKINVSEGQEVKTGDLIAFSGSTGLSTGPHLHFEISKNDKFLNPALVVSDFNNKVTSTSLGNVGIKPINQQEKEEKMGKNPLIILNGVITDIKDTANEELHINGEVKMIKPRLAIKKYGLSAIDGALEVKGEIKLVPKSSNHADKDKAENINPQLNAAKIEIRITNQMSDVELTKLKKDVKNDFDYDLTIKRLKRNSSGIITSIGINLKKDGSVVTASHSNPEGIPDIVMGETGKGELFMISGDPNEIDTIKERVEKEIRQHAHSKHDHEIEIEKAEASEHVDEEHEVEEVELEEKDEEKEIEVDAQSTWQVSPGTVIKEVDYNEEKEVVQPYQVKTAAISKLKFENGVDIEKYEFVFVVGKNSSDTYLDDMAKELKKTFNIAIKISKLKRNENNEITSIKISLDDNKGNKSSATFKKGDNPIPNIAVGKENDNLIVRSIADSNRPDTDYLYPSGQSFKLESGLNPLHILDGKVISEEDFTKLDYRNIESVNVLKGKAAKALYGEKGKNGVVVVKTKKK